MMNISKLFRATVVVALGVVGGSALADAIIYEPFGQTEGDLNSQAGGTGLNTWSDNNTVTVAETPSLSYGDVPYSGGQVNLITSAGTDAWVTTTTALADAGLLADGATLWFSTMFMKTAGGGSNEWAGWAFGTERVDAAYNGINMLNSGNGVGFATRSTGVSVATWLGGGNASQGGGFTIAYSTPVLIVGKIEWGAAADDVETITLYNPSTTNLPMLGTGVSKTVTGFDQTALDTISMSQRNSSGTFTFDEIRFGATYDDVIGKLAPPGGTMIFVR